jgi:hypothetical protein
MPVQIAIFKSVLFVIIPVGAINLPGWYNRTVILLEPPWGGLLVFNGKTIAVFRHMQLQP